MWYCWLISARLPKRTPVPSSNSASPVRTSRSGPLRTQYPPPWQATSSTIPVASFGSFPIASQFCEITSTSPRKTSAAPSTARIVSTRWPRPAAASSNSMICCRWSAERIPASTHPATRRSSPPRNGMPRLLVPTHRCNAGCGLSMHPWVGSDSRREQGLRTRGLGYRDVTVERLRLKFGATCTNGRRVVRPPTEAHTLYRSGLPPSRRDCRDAHPPRRAARRSTCLRRRRPR